MNFKNNIQKCVLKNTQLIKIIKKLQRNAIFYSKINFFMGKPKL